MVRPEEVADPNNDPATKKLNKTTIDRIKKLKKDIKVLEDTLRNKQQEKTNASIDIETFKELKAKIENIGELSKQIERKNADLLTKHKLNWNEIITFHTNLKPIEELIVKKQKRVNQLSKEIEYNDNENSESIPRQIKTKSNLLEDENKKLSIQQQNYQKYLSEVDHWKKRKAEIEGDVNTPYSIK